jgi:hypothetical protein
VTSGDVDAALLDAIEAHDAGLHDTLVQRLQAARGSQGGDE